MYTHLTGGSKHCKGGTKATTLWCFMSAKVARSLGASVEIGSVTGQNWPLRWTNVTEQNSSDETDCGLDVDQPTKLFGSQTYRNIRLTETRKCVGS